MTDAAETDLPFPEDARREVFAALVAAQDGGLGVGPSRQHVADQFEVTVEDVRAVEREGLENQWPPL